jgi:hypothetical protein
MARSFDSFIKFLGSLVLLPIWVLASGVCFLLEIIKLIHQGKGKKKTFPSAEIHFPVILYDHYHSCGTVNSLHVIKKVDRAIL